MYSVFNEIHCERTNESLLCGNGGKTKVVHCSRWTFHFCRKKHLRPAYIHLYRTKLSQTLKQNWENGRSVWAACRISSNCSAHVWWMESRPNTKKTHKSINALHKLSPFVRDVNSVRTHFKRTTLNSIYGWFTVGKRKQYDHDLLKGKRARHHQIPIQTYVHNFIWNAVALVRME